MDKKQFLVRFFDISKLCDSDNAEKFLNDHPEYVHTVDFENGKLVVISELQNCSENPVQIEPSEAEKILSILRRDDVDN